MINRIEEKFQITTDGELKELLSLCEKEPLFFDDEKRLLSIEEIIQAQEELQIQDNIIAIIDLYDNVFVVYDILKKEFMKYDIAHNEAYGKIDTVQEYIHQIKEYKMHRK